MGARSGITPEDIGISDYGIDQGFMEFFQKKTH